WWGSNYGSTTQDAGNAVDVIAPTIMPTTDIGGSAGYDSGDYSMWFNGTSCATPYAAGAAALVLSANPTFTPAQLRDALTSTATDVVNVESGTGWDRYSGYGMVNVDAAVGGGGPVAPTAAFSGAPTSGTFPLTVNFSDLSTGAPTSWSWTFGDGGTSTQQNPSYTYTAAGTYTVSLTATNATGSDTDTKVDYITVTAPPPPTAAFTGTPTSGSYPLDVTFTDQSSGAPTSWSWTFGDGGTSTQQNPSYTYTAAGTYTVSLTASNAYGSDTDTKVDYITVTEPGVTAFVTADSEVSVIGTVSGSYVDTKFSDGVSETITEVEYTGHPVKRYSYAEHKWSFNLPAGSDATFHLEALRSNNTEGDDFVFAYSTDGVNFTNVATVSSATEQTFSVPLGPLSGAVTVRATDTDRNWGNVALDNLLVDYIAFEVGDVVPTAPTADFAGTPVSGDYPLNVDFTDLSSGDPTSWSWTFGDGGTSTAQNPSYTYAAAGTYTVSLTATNAQGSDTATKTGYITVTEPGSGPTTMHVSDMAVSRAKSGPNYFGVCDITVIDDQGGSVGGATVTVSYNGPTNGTTSGTTAADGTLTLQATGMKKPVGEWCFEVTNITHGTLTYDPGSNVTTRSCESGDVNGSEFVETSSFVSSEFSLDQNAPNPFNPMTEIKFNLPRSMNATLTVYNVRGQAVTTLKSGIMSAGQHSVTWDARNHASGVYFYRLETPDFSETKKMIMLK
ncbi:MAG: PKD domain-containing protein, partial [Candidatus Krumholzibacteriota bacterium]